jgi:hypothetical protein
MPGGQPIYAKYEDKQNKKSQEEKDNLVLLDPEDHPREEGGALAQPRLHVTQPPT